MFTKTVPPSLSKLFIFSLPQPLPLAWGGKPHKHQVDLSAFPPPSAPEYVIYATANET